MRLQWRGVGAFDAVPPGVLWARGACRWRLGVAPGLLRGAVAVSVDLVRLLILSSMAETVTALCGVSCGPLWLSWRALRLGVGLVGVVGFCGLPGRL